MRKGEYKHSDEAKDKIRKAFVARIAERGHPRKGLKATPETRKRMSEVRLGPKSPNWKGGRLQRKDGYVDLLIRPEHPMAAMARADGYATEHRIVMAQHLGRPLARTEHVHHRNGIKNDNRIENLLVMTGKEHSRVGRGQVATALVERIIAEHLAGRSAPEIATLLTEERFRGNGREDV